MASSDNDRTGPARRPALVDELERMGFRPADPLAVQAPTPGPGDTAGPRKSAGPRDPAGSAGSAGPAGPAGSAVLPDGPPKQAAGASADARGPATASRDTAARRQPGAYRPDEQQAVVVEPGAQEPDPAPAEKFVPIAQEPDPASAEKFVPIAQDPDPAPAEKFVAVPRQQRSEPAVRPAERPDGRRPAGHVEPAGRQGAGQLTADEVLRERVEPPAGGWRRAVFRSSFGAINPGLSAAERRDRDLIARASRPVPGCWRVAVISLKGGVGKTTTTAGLGVQLATLRGDRVVAVDANPDRGTLAEKVPESNPATVRDLLRNRDRIRRYSDVREFTSLSPSRLEVLASDADPQASQAFSEQDYREAVEVLEHFYSLVLTDCGTGLLHSAMSGVLALADALVVVSSASLDGARSASATLDWLEAHGRADLVSQAVAVVSSVRPRGGLIDVAAVQEHFERRCRTVVQVPFDPHLEAGATVSLERMAPRTRQAYLELAAAVGDGMP